MTKFTPAYIAQCREAKGGVWRFPQAKTALDEIEMSHDMIDRLIGAGEVIYCGRWMCRLTSEEPLKKWNKLVAEWQSR